MSMQISRAQVEKAMKRVEALKSKANNAMKKADEVLETAVTSVEVTASAFAAGLIQGKWGSIELVGVPLELGVSAGCHVLGFFGVGGKFSDHLHHFGDGFLAAYAATMGRGAGQAWKEKELTGGSGKALPGAKGSGMSLTDAEIAAAARSV